MYEFKNNKNGVFWHEQAFTLKWKFPISYLVCVLFYNGNRKVVLPIVTNSSDQVVDGNKFKRTNFILTLFKKKYRVYRYKRFYLKKAEDKFSNIANYRSQYIRLYIFITRYPWIKVVDVSMDVKLLRLRENKINVKAQSIQLATHNMTVISQTISVLQQNLRLFNIDLQLNIPAIKPNVNLQLKNHEPRFSICNLISSGEISDQTDNQTILQLIN